MAENVTIRIDADNRASRALRSVQDRIRQVGDTATRVGRSLTLGVTAPLTALGGAAAKMAADAEEAANKFDVVMGDSAARVRGELERLTETIPLTRSQMEGMASSLQDMMVPMGVAREEAAGMSVEMVKLAGDIASFNNVATDRVLEAFGSALAGESEPMRRFGVDTRQTRLEMLALEEGLISAGEEMDETARAQATLMAIQRDSTDAIGDAERTADSFTNALRFLRRDLRQLGEDIGRVIVPAVRPMINAFRDVTEQLTELPQETVALGVALGGLAAAAGPVLLGFGQLANIFSVVVGTAPGVIGAIGGIRAALQTLNASLGPTGWLLSGIGAVATAWLGWKGASAVATSAIGSVQRKLEDMVEALDPANQMMDELEQNLLETFGDPGRRLEQEAENFRSLQGEIAATESRLESLRGTQGTSRVAAGRIRELEERLSELRRQARLSGERMNELSRQLGRVGEDADGTAGPDVDGGLDRFSQETQALLEEPARILGRLSLHDTIRAPAREQLEGGLVGAVEDIDMTKAWEGALNTNLEAPLLEFGDEMKRSMARLGSNLVTSLMDGAASMSDRLKSFFKSVIGLAIELGLRSQLGIASPSKVMRGFGRDIVDGLIVGMGDRLGALRTMTQRVGATAASISSPRLGGMGQLASAGASGVARPSIVFQMPRARSGSEQAFVDEFVETAKKAAHHGAVIEFRGR